MADRTKWCPRTHRGDRWRMQENLTVLRTPSAAGPQSQTAGERMLSQPFWIRGHRQAENTVVTVQTEVEPGQQAHRWTRRVNIRPGGVAVRLREAMRTR